MKHTTLVQAHHIKQLSLQGLSTRAIEAETGVCYRTVARILNGDGLVQQRRMADMMESFLGGVILGSGSTRFHAASPSADNDDGHIATKAHHSLDVPYESGSIVPLGADVLAEVLAEEDLIDRIRAAGVDPEELLIIDPETDTEEQATGKFENDNAVLRDKNVHEETWAEFETRCKSSAHGNWRAYMAKALENEGADVDVWAVRDPDFMGWGLPHHHIERSPTA